MAACKVCKKSEVSMLCICKDCFGTIQEISIELEKENEKLKTSLMHCQQRYCELTDEKDEYSARNRELVEKSERMQNVFMLCKEFFNNVAPDQHEYVGQYSKHMYELIEMIEEVE